MAAQRRPRQPSIQAPSLLPTSVEVEVEATRHLLSAVPIVAQHLKATNLDIPHRPVAGLADLDTEQPTDDLEQALDHAIDGEPRAQGFLTHGIAGAAEALAHKTDVPRLKRRHAERFVREALQLCNLARLGHGTVRQISEKIDDGGGRIRHTTSS